MLFHDECIDKTDNICYGCLGITKQRAIMDNPTQDSSSINEYTTGNTTNTSPKQTKMSLNENDDESNKSPTPTRLITIEPKNATQIGQHRNLKDDVNSESIIPKTTSILNIDGKLNNNNNSSKEMRQIELKLKKKEEQLKI